MITSEFQYKLVKDYETLALLVRVFHPEIPQKIERSPMNSTMMTLAELIEWQTNNRSQPYLGAHTHYDWVCVHIDVTGYGQVRICVDNAHDESSTLWGPDIKAHHYEDLLSKGKIIMKAWKIVTDCKSEKGENHINVTDLLTSRGYQFKSTKEFLEYYYSD
tara:strand:+ start:1334 stop:1816 length:483 start_codon:yes stop_codon:yes gene_type:complete